MKCFSDVNVNAILKKTPPLKTGYFRGFKKIMEKGEEL